MPQEALSQNDIDRMLRDLASGGGLAQPAKPADETASGVAAARSSAHAAAASAAQDAAARRIRNYDFRRPNRISKEHMRGLRLIFETFGRDVPRAWGPLLRAGGQVKLSTIEQTIYEEYRNHLAPHVFICTVTIPPLEGEFAFQLDLDAAYIIVDRLLGGPGTGLKHVRELTSLELNILQRTVTAMLPAWRDAWLSIIHLEPAIARSLSSSEFLQLTSINESVLVVTYELKFLNNIVELSICIPYSVIAPILSRVVANESTFGMQGNDEMDRRRLDTHLRQTVVSVAARLGTAPIPIIDLTRIAVGDIIRLDVPRDGLGTLHIGPRPYFTVRPGLTNGNLAVQVVDHTRSPG